MRYTSSLEEAEKQEKDAADNGKAIEIAVPMLCERLNNSDGTVRTNALGAIIFLMPDTDRVTSGFMITGL